MMIADRSLSNDFQHHRHLSVDAEDQLFKSLQGLQERNHKNSQRQQQRTNIASKRRSLDLKGGQRTNNASPVNHSNRIYRRTSLELNGRQRTITASPRRNHHSDRNTKRRNSSDINRRGSNSGPRERRSTDASKANVSSESCHTRRQRRNSISNNGLAQRNSWHGQKNLRNVTPTGAQLNNGSSGRTIRKGSRIRRRGSTGMGDSPGVIPKSLNNSVQTNIRNVTPTGTELCNGGVVSKSQPLRLEDRQSSGETTRKAYRLGEGRRASTGMGPEINPKITPKRLGARRSNPETLSNPVATTGPPLVIRSFSRRHSLCSSPTSSPTNPAGCNFYPAANQKCAAKSSRERKDWTVTTSKADLRRGTKPPRLDNCITTLTCFVGDEDDSENTESTKPLSERSALSDRSDIADLDNLLGELKDPAEVERRRMEREGLSGNTSSKSLTTQPTHIAKVAEQSSSRSLKTFLKRSKRGYAPQANLDAPSAM